MAEYTNLEKTLDGVNAVEQAVDRVERLVKEYSDPIQKLNKSLGGFGIGLTKFGAINAKLEVLNDRLELEQKQTKQLLAFQMRFENVLKAPSLKNQLDKFGPQILGDTIQDALAAGGPALAEAIDLGAMMTGVGKDPAKMFEFIKDFRNISGFNADQQKQLISSLKRNFARQDALISALGELTSTLQATAQLSPKISENIVSLLGDLTNQFPGLEQQFGDFFKTFLTDATIGRGYLGAELANAQKDLVQKLISKSATKEDILDFIDLVSTSPEIKAREEFLLAQAGTTGLLQDSIVQLSQMAGPLALLARNLDSAVKTTNELNKVNVVPQKAFEGQELENQITNQLDINLDKINNAIKITKEDFFEIQKYAAKIGADLTFSLDQLQGTIQETAESVNKNSLETLRNIRAEEEKLSDAYTKYAIGRDIFDVSKGAISAGVDILAKAKETADAARGRLGESCAKPMYVVICDEGIDAESKKKSDTSKKGWLSTAWDKFKGWIGGILTAIGTATLAFGNKFKDFAMKTIPMWWKGLSPLMKGLVIAGVTAAIAAIFALINSMLEVGGTTSKMADPIRYTGGRENFEANKATYESLLLLKKSYEDSEYQAPPQLLDAIKQLQEVLQEPETKNDFYKFLQERNIDPTTNPPPIFSEENSQKMGAAIGSVLEKKLNSINFVMPENEAMLGALADLKDEVSIVSKTIIETRFSQRYEPTFG